MNEEEEHGDEKRHQLHPPLLEAASHVYHHAVQVVGAARPALLPFAHAVLEDSAIVKKPFFQ